MNEKEYNLIAGVFREALEGGLDTESTVRFMTSRLANTYDNFDIQKFLIACGLEV